MNSEITYAPIDETDLQTILAAWNQATERLQQTHEALRNEVKRLTDELEAKNHELARKNRLADLGQMAAHVAHEVRNGLVPIKLYLSLLRRRIAHDEGTLEILNKTRADFSTLEWVVTDLLQFTSQREPQWCRFDPQELCEELCDSLTPRFETHNLEVTLHFPDEHPIMADREMMRRALLNLLLNALDVLPDRGQLLVEGLPTAEGFAFHVLDSGPGLPDSALPHIFEPFFTTKSHGTGLGLAIVARIAELHGGTAVATNTPAGGALFTISIPQPESLALPWSNACLARAA